MLETVEPGLLSTIQDAGRRDVGHLGVRRAGAADALALAAANLLVGNAPDTPALEMTLLGGTFAIREACLLGIAGADMEAHLLADGRQLPSGASYWVSAGATLVFGAATDGARSYLALAGGMASEWVLGSASTDPVAGFGGLHGRALRSGDILAAARPERRPERRWPAGMASSGVPPSNATGGEGPRSVSVVEGPHHGLLSGDDRDALVGGTWRVTARSDRVGLRLDGARVPGAEVITLVSQPMLPGSVQLPPAGLPIVLMPDAPSIGGYPVPAVVAEVDHPVTGQLRPGDDVRFEWLGLGVARERARVRDAWLAGMRGSTW
jgi:5-oxoprolinase (ATP-hydrolysing) subunit C